jgi:hypothetical protein
MKPALFLIAALLFAPTPVVADPPSIELIDAAQIWDDAPHSAFTDLIFWQGRFICAFREGRAHVSSDGKIRILTSPDGKDWQSAAVVELADFDLRDAGLSVAPDGRLMLIGGAAARKRDNESAPTGTFVAFSEDSHHWTEPRIVVEPGRWLWRLTWHDNAAYGVAYAAGDGHPYSSLLVTDDGTSYRQLVPKLLGDGYPTEASLRFANNGTLYCLQRRDGQPPSDSAMLGISRPPYTDWQWHDLRLFFGGPNFIQLPSGHFIAAGRIHRPGGAKTELAWLDVEKKTLIPALALPSGGDTSYPGLVWHDDHLWVSYYASHEGKTNVYLAKLRVK